MTKNNSVTYNFTWFSLKKKNEANLVRIRFLLDIKKKLKFPTFFVFILVLAPNP